MSGFFSVTLSCLYSRCVTLDGGPTILYDRFLKFPEALQPYTVTDLTQPTAPSISIAVHHLWPCSCHIRRFSRNTAAGILGTSTLAQAVKLLASGREVPGSDLSQDTDCHDWGFCNFSQCFQQVPVYFLKSDYGSFLPHTLQFIIHVHQNIGRYITWANDSFVKWTTNK